MNYCKFCTTKKINCKKCSRSPKNKNIKDFFEPDRSDEYYDKLCLEKNGYIPVCPRGYLNCVNDPAYIKYNYPDWYEEMWGNKTVQEAAEDCRQKMKEDPEEKYYCYDDEDK